MKKESRDLVASTGHLCANPATACKQNLLRLVVRFFSPFFSLKQNKINSKNRGETNFEVLKKQKDV